MIAIIERTALASMTGHGMTPQQAIDTLARIKPCASYEGKPYYKPDHIYKAIRAFNA